MCLHKERSKGGAAQSVGLPWVLRASICPSHLFLHFLCLHRSGRLLTRLLVSPHSSQHDCLKMLQWLSTTLWIPSKVLARLARLCLSLSPPAALSPCSWLPPSTRASCLMQTATARIWLWDPVSAWEDLTWGIHQTPVYESPYQRVLSWPLVLTTSTTPFVILHLLICHTFLTTFLTYFIFDTYLLVVCLLTRA